MILREVQVKNPVILTKNGECLKDEKEIGPTEELFLEEKTRAFDQGVIAGEKRGYKSARKELLSLLNASNALSEKLIEEKRQLLEKLKPEVVDFSLAVCEKLLRRELSHPESMIKWVVMLLKTALPGERSKEVKVYLSPSDFEALEGEIEVKGFEALHFYADERITSGDVRIETPEGLLNMQIARELDDLRLKVLSHEASIA